MGGERTRAACDRSSAGSKILTTSFPEILATCEDLVDRLFGGSAESLVMSMVQTRHISTAELARVHRLLDDSKE